MLIRESFGRCCLVVALQLGAACAQGYATEPPEAIEVPVVDAGHAVFTGEACTIGDRMPCTCPAGDTGLRACVANSTSPTGGALSGCLPCDSPPAYAAGHSAAGTGQMSGAVTEPPAAGKSSTSGGSGGAGRGGGASASASTTVGKGGSGSGGAVGASGRGGAGGSASGGAGGKAAAGSGGSKSSGSTGGSKTCSSDCSAQLCFPLGVLGCCKTNGTCGCTWAPGAYCM